MIQNILLIGAFVLLSITILNVNDLMVTTDQSFINNESEIAGLGLAQSLMAEIIALAFDEKTTGNLRVRTPLELTLSSDFGPHGSEPVKDDVDDYQNYFKVMNTPRIDGYRLEVKVTYANTFNPKDDILSRSFLKRVKIIVTNPKFMKNPASMILSTVVAYYK